MSLTCFSMLHEVSLSLFEMVIAAVYLLQQWAVGKAPVETRDLFF